MKKYLVILIILAGCVSSPEIVETPTNNKISESNAILQGSEDGLKISALTLMNGNR